MAVALLVSYWAGDLYAQTASNMADTLPTFAESKLDLLSAEMTQNSLDTGVMVHGVANANQRSRAFVTSTDEVSWRLRRFTLREQRFSGVARASLVIWDEDYLDSRDRGWGTETAFEQNRSFAGLRWRSSPANQSEFEFGYLNQTWDEPGQDDRRFHFLSLNFYF